MSGRPVVDIKSYLFSFNGRINRARYLFVSLIYLFITIAIVSLTLVFASPKRAGGDRMLDFLPLILLGAALFAGAGWSWAATTVKRLHDRNKSGWWMIPMFAVPFVLNLFAKEYLPAAFAMSSGLIAAAIGLWSFIETICLRGTRGANRYGPDPLPKTRRLFA